MRIAEVFASQVGGDSASIRFEAFDGSTAGPPDEEIGVHIRSPRALAYLATAPGGGLGLARAYISGDLEVTGDLYTAMRRLSGARARSSWPERIRTLRALGGPRLLIPPAPPPYEVRLRGRMHSRARDQAAIAHHYDVSNTFYELLLGPSMAYTCAVYPTAAATLEEAQFEKYDLVARKLALRPGMRLLDVGCGWGGMVRHAVQHYGVTALGVTLSRQQAEWGQKMLADEGLTDRGEIRHLDYREVGAQRFDAISSIGLTEHIGRAQLPGYFRFLYERLEPGGRLLNHCITRPNNSEPAVRKRMFINRYVFPDGELSGVGRLASAMNDAGFEIRHEENLREHYAKTLAAWSANLDRHWDEAVAEVGLGRARVWRLYLAGSRLGFEGNEVQLHQLLGTRLTADASARMPLRPDW